MDYKEKYEMALERAKNLHKDAIDMGETIRAKQCEIIFPELVESEDEKIRKEIQSVIEQLDKDTTVCGKKYDYNQWLSWLEKQREKSQGKSALEAINEVKVDNQNCVKSVDKVEPKFKVGDWVVQGYNILKIRCVGDTHYCFETVGGYVDDMLVSEIDSQFHLWTIQDAKDGDVLHSPSHRLIFIYKNNEHYHASVNMNYITENIAIYGLIKIPSDVCPATSVQRAILFSKMEESGYEWNAEKKELKKVERKPIDYNEELKKYRENPLYFFDKYVKLKPKKQKSAWSEEDEKMFMSLHNLIYVVRDCDCDSMRKKELSDWLDSLKDRVQSKQKQEWGKEDEKCIRLSTDIIDSALRAGFCLQLDRDRCVDWLKSIKNQNKWKPSDEQMIALRQVISGCSYDIKPLVELEAKLKEF